MGLYVPYYLASLLFTFSQSFDFKRFESKQNSFDFVGIPKAFQSSVE
jgi:hypothetical protein